MTGWQSKITLTRTVLLAVISALTLLSSGVESFVVCPSTATTRAGSSATALAVMDPSSVLSNVVAMSPVLIASDATVSPEPIHTAFSVATFLPQPFWLLLILLPNTKITKSLMGDLKIPILCCLLHLFIVVMSIVLGGAEATAPLAEFNNVFDPSGDPQAAFIGMTRYPNFVAEEWSHVLTWDLFVGQYIWRDGVKRDIFTGHSVLLTNLIGPPGLLLHWLTCAFYGKPVYEEEAVV